MNLSDENFDKEINASPNKLVVVDFFAVWCEPCSMLAPILDKAVENFGGKVVLAKVNIDQAPQTAQKFSVEKIPTVVLFKDGKAISGFVGMAQKETIENWLKNYLDGKN